MVDALQALDPDDPATDEHLIEELGDLLYQIEFHATIAEQEGRFTIADVAAGVHDKLVRRHPHVFGVTVRSSSRRRRRGRRCSPTGTTSNATRSDGRRCSTAFPGRCRRWRTRPRSRGRRPRSASTGPTSTARSRRSPRRPASCDEAIDGVRPDDATRRARRPAVRRRQRRPPPRHRSGSRAARPRPTSSGPGSRRSSSWPPTGRSICARATSPPSTPCGTRSRTSELLRGVRLRIVGERGRDQAPRGSPSPNTSTRGRRLPRRHRRGPTGA